MAGHAGWRFTRLELQNWRNFGNCEMRLAQRVFIVGPNASGKSNLLDVFQFLHDLVNDVGGLAAVLDDTRGGISSVRALQAGAQSPIHICVEVGRDATKPVWRYELVFTGKVGKKPQVVRERAWRGGVLVLDRPTSDDIDDPERMLQTAIEHRLSNRKIRELASFFRSTTLSHFVPQFLREGSPWSPKDRDIHGSDLRQRMARTSEPAASAGVLYRSSR